MSDVRGLLGRDRRRRSGAHRAALAVCLLLGGATAGCQSTGAAPSSGQGPLPPTDLQALAELWLATDCHSGDDLSLRQQLLANRVALEPLFLAALERGPGDPLRKHVRGMAESRDAEIEAFVRSGGRTGTRASPGQPQEPRATPELVEADFVLAYRSRAITGLAVVGGIAAKVRLRAIAADPKDPLRSSAEWALPQLPP